MDDQRVGWSLRSIRIRKRWRQQDLATRARVSRWIVMRIEHGRLSSIPVGKIRAVAAALDARFDGVVRWQGGDLTRLVSARHARMHEIMARHFRTLPEWIAEHGAVLRSKLPTDGRGITRWLRRPVGGIDALSFLPAVHGMHPGVDPAQVRRVVRPRSARNPLDSSVD